jgi:sulfur-oxidizing protein SoxA
MPCHVLTRLIRLQLCVKPLRLMVSASLAVGLLPLAAAQSATDAIAKYREMIAEGNPAELYEAAGEDYWNKPGGPKKATLQSCDLGLGPGVVKGAYARLPRWFADTGKVQDLESRLMTCMEQIQGIPSQSVIDAPFAKGAKKDIEAVVAYVVTQSREVPIKVSMAHAKEREMYEIGKRVFYYQAGPMDFSCASCHAADNQRIRLQDLPKLTQNPGAATGWGSWPAYRVSSGEFWTMQRRINDCFRQQRLPYPIYGSELTVALSSYMAVNANGGLMLTPGLKR